MLGVVIVDDEILARVGVKSLIEWESQGYQIIGEASNGSEGLKFILDKKPDIVITDIKMPVMDGLEMIQKSRENNIYTKFIVLSSYDEFELVKKAMKLGAEDYIIKLELDEQVLLKTLKPVKQKVLKEKEKTKNESVIKHNINTEKSMRREFFKKLIGNLIKNENEINCIVKQLNIDIDFNRLVCMVTRINNLYTLKKFDNKDLRLFEFSVTNIIQEIINDFFAGYVFVNSWGEVLIIISIDRELNRRDYLKKVKEMAWTVVSMLMKYLDISTNIAISELHDGIAQLSQAYQEACQGLEYSFYCQSGEPVFYHELQQYKTIVNDELELLKVNRLFSKCLDTVDKVGLETLFEELIREITIKNISKAQVYDLCYDLIYVINNQLKTEEIKKIFPEEKYLYGSIDKLNNKSEVINWIKDLKERLTTLIDEHKSNEHLFLIGQAKKYIHQHFNEDISLNEVARTINISSGYLSSLFKDVEDTGFNEYITDLRIKEAKRLLSNSNKKVYEISGEIGYNNPYYFSRVFKRITGQTPSEFREKKY